METRPQQCLLQHHLSQVQPSLSLLSHLTPSQHQVAHKHSPEARQQRQPSQQHQRQQQQQQQQQLQKELSLIVQALFKMVQCPPLTASLRRGVQFPHYPKAICQQFIPQSISRKLQEQRRRFQQQRVHQRHHQPLKQPLLFSLRD